MGPKLYVNTIPVILFVFYVIIFIYLFLFYTYTLVDEIHFSYLWFGMNFVGQLVKSDILPI